MFQSDFSKFRAVSLVKRCSQRMRSLPLAVLLMTGVALSASGCNYAVFLGYLIGGPPMVEPDFEAKTGQSFTDYEVTVAVVCYAPTDLRSAFDSIDRDISKHVSYKLASRKVKVVSPDLVQAWLDQNPNWDKVEEIGEALNVNFVVYIDMHKYSLYEEHSAHLYRGHAEGMVSVYEMQGGFGEKIYSKELNEIYPTRMARSANEVTFTAFKKDFLMFLSERIGRMFYSYGSGDDISDAT